MKLKRLNGLTSIDLFTRDLVTKEDGSLSFVEI